MTPANRVIINTAILYGRMVLTIGVSLYSTRLILQALGSTDYGIFQLVGGVIAMLAFLKNAMATSTQRFLSFHQGKNDIESQRSVFTNSLLIHLVGGLFLVLVLASLESFLFEQFLNIPDNRIYAAKIVYRTMLFSLFFSMVNVPFMGSLIAHENMIVVAIINILESLLKLAIAFVLISLVDNRLIIYGWLTAILALLILLLYMGYCFRKFDECTLQGFFKVDKVQVKQLTSFAGWNLFGSLCGLGRNQGLAILLNLYFGAAINAAYGIANQVAAQMNFFSATLLRAMNPQIMKSEGSGNRDRMLRLSMMASKFGFFLVALIVIPAIFEMTEILELWLKEVPDYTVIFTQLILLSILLNQLTIGLQSALQATGRIKLYQSVVGGIILLTLPLAYVFLKLGYAPQSVFISYLSIEVVAVVLRLYFARIIAGLTIRTYLERVFAREILPVLLSVICCYLITTNLDFGLRFLLTGIASAIILAGSIYLLGLCEDEKVFVHQFLTLAKNKIYKRQNKT